MTVIRYIHQNPVKAGIVERIDSWPWSSYPAYCGQVTYPKDLINSKKVLQMVSEDLTIAREKFKEFNEQNNQDECMDEGWKRRRLTDEQAREEMNQLLGDTTIPQVKSLPKSERNEALQKIKLIEGLSQRQASRILGVSPSLIKKAWF